MFSIIIGKTFISLFFKKIILLIYVKDYGSGFAYSVTKTRNTKVEIRYKHINIINEGD